MCKKSRPFIAIRNSNSVHPTDSDPLCAYFGQFLSPAPARARRVICLMSFSIADSTWKDGVESFAFVSERSRETKRTAQSFDRGAAIRKWHIIENGTISVLHLWMTWSWRISLANSNALKFIEGNERICARMSFEQCHKQRRTHTNNSKRNEFQKETIAFDSLIALHQRNRYKRYISLCARVATLAQTKMDFYFE